MCHSACILSVDVAYLFQELDKLKAEEQDASLESSRSDYEATLPCKGIRIQCYQLWRCIIDNVVMQRHQTWDDSRLGSIIIICSYILQSRSRNQSDLCQNWNHDDWNRFQMPNSDSTHLCFKYHFFQQLKF